MTEAKDALASDLRIGGFQPFSMTDYPDALSAVVFCQGCALRCVYCHNPALLDPAGPAQIPWREVRERLVRRKGLLDAVVFSGGEPLLQRALPAAMKAVRDLGFRVGLHTSGIAPARLAAVMPIADWVGLDIKCATNHYERLTGVDGAGEKAMQSLNILARSNVQFEVRTTLWPDAQSENELRIIAKAAERAGADQYVLQEARVPETAKPVFGLPDVAAICHRLKTDCGPVAYRSAST